MKRRFGVALCVAMVLTFAAVSICFVGVRAGERDISVSRAAVWTDYASIFYHGQRLSQADGNIVNRGGVNYLSLYEKEDGLGYGAYYNTYGRFTYAASAGYNVRLVVSHDGQSDLAQYYNDNNGNEGWRVDYKKLGVYEVVAYIESINPVAVVETFEFWIVCKSGDANYTAWMSVDSKFRGSDWTVYRPFEEEVQIKFTSSGTFYKVATDIVTDGGTLFVSRNGGGDNARDEVFGEGDIVFDYDTNAVKLKFNVTEKASYRIGFELCYSVAVVDRLTGAMSIEEGKSAETFVVLNFVDRPEDKTWQNLLVTVVVLLAFGAVVVVSTFFAKHVQGGPKQTHRG